jgi:hypothetical protein
MTTPAHIVVGGGSEAILVAATLVASGQRVTRVVTGPHLPAGLACGNRPSWRENSATSELGARIHGPVRSVESESCGLVVAGATWPLPLSPLQLSKILPRGSRRESARSWTRARARNALSIVVGGGQEERTYRDWVVRRMGAPAYDHLYADYAERRWGRSGEHLASSVARVAHSPALATQRVVPADVRDHTPSRAEALLSAHGGAVYSAGSLRLEGEGGRIRRMVLPEATLDTEDSIIWTTSSPARVAEWLGDLCPPAARHLAAGLSTSPGVRLRLTGALPDLPDELHVLDPAPCWRLVRAPDDSSAWIVSATGALSTSLVEDIRDFAVQNRLAAETATVTDSAELPEGVPAWGPVDHARLRTVLDAWRPLGIRLTGSAGTLTKLDPTDLVAHVATVLDGGPDALQEAWRTIAAPPTRVDDLQAHITHFFADVRAGAQG